MITCLLGEAIMDTTVKKVGFRDAPVTSQSDDSLDVSKYVDVLSKFVINCETPMTIAIQGDWGSGKTSFMNMIRNDLPQNIKNVWLNTWQFSQFSQTDSLCISVICSLIRQLEDKKQITVKSIKTISKGFANFAARAVTAGGAGIEDLQGSNNDQNIDMAEAIEDLNRELIKLVKKVISSSTNYDRIVVFIDDLDRLIPERAVELLETLKLFIDIENCVFILALDYQIVQRGFSAKFGIEAGKIGTKSFFDKIIQVPFNMPIGSYNVKAYVEALFSKLEMKYDKLDDYQELLASSIGFNPRGLKRLANVLTIWLAFNNIKEETTGIDDECDINSFPEENKTKLLFALTCMQTAYEPLYNYLIQKPYESTLDELRDVDSYKNKPQLTNIMDDILNFAERQAQIKNFIDLLIKAIQLDNDPALSKKEMNFLVKMLDVSRVTQTDNNELMIESKVKIANDTKSILCRSIVKHLKKSIADDLEYELIEYDNYSYARKTDYNGYPAREFLFGPGNEEVHGYFLVFVNNEIHFGGMVLDSWLKEGLGITKGIVQVRNELFKAFEGCKDNQKLAGIEAERRGNDFYFYKKIEDTIEVDENTESKIIDEFSKIILSFDKMIYFFPAVVQQRTQNANNG